MSRQVKNTDNAIKRLTKHLESNGWSVTIGTDIDEGSECDPSTRSITINEKKPIKILHTMLHEAGHSLIFTIDDYHQSFGEIARQDKWRLDRQTKLYHYQKLKEEMLAWETGLNIAKSLNIFIDEVAYDKEGAEAFMTYTYRASQSFYRKHVEIMCEANDINIDFGLYD